VTSTYTGWRLNHCDNAQPVKDILVSCYFHGGEISAVKILRAKNESGDLISDFDQILVVQHALMVESGNTNRWCFDVTAASADLEKATGIKFIAMSYQRDCK
jgi:hypothetical protein